MQGPALPLMRCVEPVKSPSIPEAQVRELCSTDISSQVIVELGVVFCDCPLQAVNCCLFFVVETGALKMK